MTFLNIILLCLGAFQLIQLTQKSEVLTGSHFRDRLPIRSTDRNHDYFNPLPKIRNPTRQVAVTRSALQIILKDEVATGYFAGEASLLPISQSKSIIGYCLVVVSTININLKYNSENTCRYVGLSDRSDQLMELCICLSVWMMLQVGTHV